MEKVSYGKIELHIIAKVARIPDSLLVRIFNVKLGMVRRLLRGELQALSSVDAIIETPYTSKKGKRLSRFYLSAAQFDIALNIFDKFQGLQNKADKKLILQIRQAFSRYLTDSVERSYEASQEKKKLAQLSDMASLSEREEDLRKLIVTQDFPKALYLMLGDSNSPVYQDLMAAIDNLITLRVNQVESRLLAILRKDLRHYKRRRKRS